VSFFLCIQGVLAQKGAFLTRLGVAEHRRATAECGAAAIVTTAATTTAHTAPPYR